jgi:hypothetical protein
MIVFVPWSLLVTTIFLGLDTTKAILSAILVDVVRTILALFSLIFIIIVLVLLIFSFFVLHFIFFLKILITETATMQKISLSLRNHNDYSVNYEFKKIVFFTAISCVIFSHSTFSDTLTLPYNPDKGIRDTKGAYRESDAYGYHLVNNLWGIQFNPSGLVHGIDYISEIRFDPQQVNKNLNFKWNFPDKYLTTQANTVYGFPSISWRQPVPLTGWNAGSWSIKVSDIHKLHDTFDYKISDPDNVNSVLHDIWIYDENGVVNGELAIFTKASSRTMFWLIDYFAKKAGSITYDYIGPNTSGKLIVSQSPTPNSKSGTHIQYLPNLDKGTIDLDALIRFLNLKGHLPSNYSIQAIELGVETWMGAGEIDITEFRVDFISKREITARIINAIFGKEYIDNFLAIGLNYLKENEVDQLIAAALDVALGESRTDKQVLLLLAKNILGITLNEKEITTYLDLAKSMGGIRVFSLMAIEHELNSVGIK